MDTEMSRGAVVFLAIISVLLTGCDSATTDSRDSVAAYVSAVAKRLSAHTNPDEAVTAFTDPSTRVAIYLTPEGDVGVTAGFLFTAAGESELACAMAHEIAHRSHDVPLQPSEAVSSSLSGSGTPWTREAELAADKAGAELC